jgi:hypothetical protein
MNEHPMNWRVNQVIRNDMFLDVYLILQPRNESPGNRIGDFVFLS